MTGVAVVIASRDRPDRLARTLASLANGVRHEDEVVVVDSASTTAATGTTAAEAGVRSIRCERPGLARARNAGVAATSRPIVAFTDDDCRPAPGWLDAVRVAFADATTGFVTGPVVAEGARHSARVAVVDHEGERRFSGRTDPVDIGHGANFAARRVTLEGVGGFDELLGAGGRFRAAEDHDFWLRALLAGWSGRFVPGAVVAHDQWRDRWQSVRHQWGYGLGSGAFAVKTMRVHGRAGAAVVVEELWDHGVRQLAHDARIGFKTGVAMSAFRLAGTMTGAVLAAGIPIRSGRFAER